MKLVSAWVENFGKICRQHYDFKEEGNFRYGENGSGKSTLAAFIKVMFFGFDGERKQSIEQNERKKFMPWQGGAYGGQITFRLAKKTYQIIRIFGVTPNKDIFELRDAETNLFSQDFSENIGEEIFGIDRASFVRTVFIGQDDCKLMETTGSIHAKLGAFMENTEDIGNFERAMANLAKKLSELNGRTAAGSLSQQRNKITELEMQLRQLREIEGREEELLIRQSHVQAEAERQKQLQARLDRKREELAELRAKQRMFRMTTEEQTRLSELNRRFMEGIPGKEEIRDMFQTGERIRELEQRRMQLCLTETEEETLARYHSIFTAGVPEPEEIEEIIQTFSEKEHTEKRRKELEEIIQSKVPKAKKESLEQRIQKGLLWMSLLFLVCGALLVRLQRSMVAALFLIGFVICGIAGLVLRKAREVPNAQQEIALMTARLQEEKRKSAEWNKVIVDFFDRYQMPYKEKAMPEIGYQWKSYVEDYHRLRKKQDNAEMADVIKCLNGEIVKRDAFLGKYGIQKDFGNTSISEMLISFSEEAEEYQELLDKKDQSEETEKELFRIGAILLEKTEKELAKAGAELFMQIEKVQAENAEKSEGLRLERISLERELERLQRKREELLDLETELQQSKEKYQADSHQAEMLKKTAEMLEAAKISYTEKYKYPILQGFQKYYGFLTKENPQDFELDGNTRLTKKEMGRQREPLSLSTGYQDLIGLCMRMALVEAMYPEEKPFLILDDPFIHLDERKMEKAMQLLDAIGREYQLIYFTCHRSRLCISEE